MSTTPDPVQLVRASDLPTTSTVDWSSDEAQALLRAINAATHRYWDGDSAVLYIDELAKESGLGKKIYALITSLDKIASAAGFVLSRHYDTLILRRKWAGILANQP